LKKLDLPESPFTTNQAEALLKVMPGRAIARIKRLQLTPVQTQLDPL
jgi:hypothetical protein